MSVGENDYELFVYMYHLYDDFMDVSFEEGIIAGEIAIDLMKDGEIIDRKMLLMSTGQTGFILDEADPSGICAIASLEQDVAVFQYGEEKDDLIQTLLLTVNDKEKLVWIERPEEAGQELSTAERRFFNMSDEYSIIPSGISFNAGGQDVIVTVNFELYSVYCMGEDAAIFYN